MSCPFPSLLFCLPFLFVSTVCLPLQLLCLPPPAIPPSVFNQYGYQQLECDYLTRNWVVTYAQSLSVQWPQSSNQDMKKIPMKTQMGHSLQIWWENGWDKRRWKGEGVRLWSLMDKNMQAKLVTVSLSTRYCCGFSLWRWRWWPNCGTWQCSWGMCDRSKCHPPRLLSVVLLLLSFLLCFVIILPCHEGQGAGPGGLWEGDLWLQRRVTLWEKDCV